MWRHTAQLSGNPWTKITSGLSDFKAAGEPGASLLTKWNLKPLARVIIWWERPAKSFDRSHRRSRALGAQLIKLFLLPHSILECIEGEDRHYGRSLTNLQLQGFLFSPASEVGAIFDGDASVEDYCENAIRKGKRQDDGTLDEAHVGTSHFQSIMRRQK